MCFVLFLTMCVFATMLASIIKKRTDYGSVLWQRVVSGQRGIENVLDCVMDCVCDIMRRSFVKH